MGKPLPRLAGCLKNYSDDYDAHAEYVCEGLWLCMMHGKLLVNELSPQGMLIKSNNNSLHNLHAMGLVEECERVVLSVSPDLRFVAIGTERGQIYLVDRQKNGGIRHVNCAQHHSSGVFALGFGQNGSRLIVSHRQEMHMYDLSELLQPAAPR
jgi:hypothetical protein